jgi:hypothetical protein
VSIVAFAVVVVIVAMNALESMSSSKLVTRRRDTDPRHFHRPLLVLPQCRPKGVPKARDLHAIVDKWMRATEEVTHQFMVDSVHGEPFLEVGDHKLSRDALSRILAACVSATTQSDADEEEEEEEGEGGGGGGGGGGANPATQLRFPDKSEHSHACRQARLDPRTHILAALLAGASSAPYHPPTIRTHGAPPLHLLREIAISFSRIIFTALSFMRPTPHPTRQIRRPPH